MRFARPEFLYLLLAVPVVALLMGLGAAARRRAIERFAGGRDWAARFVGEASGHRRAAKAILLLSSMSFGVLAAARPQWGTGLETIERRGVDVVIVLDTSRSMTAQDVPPDRLSLAKLAASTLLDRLTSDRVALVTFAGQAAISCPLTLDHGAVRLLLDAVEAEAIPVPGTALFEAMRLAVAAFGPAGAEARSRVVVLLSDGEDHEGGVDRAIASLRDAGVVVHAVGVGTERGAPIPDAAASGGPSGYKRDREGRIVTTRLSADTLSRLALETKGRFFRATAAGGEIDELHRTIAGMEATEAGTTLRTKWEERFQWPLALAVVALAAEALVSERRRRPAVRKEGAR